MSDAKAARMVFWVLVALIYASAAASLWTGDERMYVVTAGLGWALIVYMAFVTWAWRP